MKLRWLLLSLFVSVVAGAQPDVNVATFQADITPPVGAPLCGGAVVAVRGVDDPLTARGIVIFANGQQPIVLCAVDFTGIANAAHDQWRETLAKAANTTPDRVAVHCLHQHDAPEVDAGAEALLAAQGMGGSTYSVKHAQDA
ncbi:MAG: hypothetical protein FJY92_11025, partial [Candidatus Hydrogenedentes bacterium]|nr:hypothetical protein [Candidatus Hydrogenedentota bacterium]